MSNITFVDSEDKIKFITFSDGTETCKLVGSAVFGSHGSADVVTGKHIQIKIEDCTRDILRLGLVKDALDRLGVKEVKLTLGYIPQARADRVFEKGNPLPIKVFSDILNSYNFTKVYVYDPHSDVSTALINNVEVISQAGMLRNELKIINKYMRNFTLVAPDLGAAKKIFDTVKVLKVKDYVQGIKIRDVTTGNIIKCDIDKEVLSGNMLIVDDIADGGASFTHIAKILKERGAENVGLFVTHGIFAKGLDVLKQDIDFIFCPNIVGSYITQKDIMEFNDD